MIKVLLIQSLSSTVHGLLLLQMIKLLLIKSLSSTGIIIVTKKYEIITIILTIMFNYNTSGPVSLPAYIVGQPPPAGD